MLLFLVHNMGRYAFKKKRKEEIKIWSWIAAVNPFKICNVFASLSKITSKRGEKVKILIPKVFLRPIIHSRSFSVEKLELPYSGSYRSEFQDKCLFFYFLMLVKFFDLRPSTTRLVPLGRLELLRRTRTQFKPMTNAIQHKFNLRLFGVEPQLPLDRGGEVSTGRLQEGQDWLGGSTGQAPTWCGPKQLEHLWAKQHNKEGAMQWPRFQHLQIMSKDNAPWGSVNSYESSQARTYRCPSRMEFK